MKYKGIVFDLDGTIIDSETGIAKAFQKALATKGMTDSLENIKSLIGPPLSRTIITKYGFSEKEGAEAMKEHKKYYISKGLFESSIYEGVKELLETLMDKNIVMMIATNKPETYAVTQMEHYGLSKYFHSIVGNDIPQKRGTKKDFIMEAIESAGIRAEDAVMVGDRNIDLEAAKEIGMDTIGVLYGYGSKEEIEGCMPTHLIDAPLEILGIVLG
ncbi:HAD hydrolase-like protein [Alkalibacter saccharofermentans]|uniref:Phosphoglycolate phosphatase n=1 Tax=Alkalibacter saccharofermentans DSM 14828 TaxID=1120975 RepID=A0A1M4YEN2_9FIRM|nr:HAD hydrolase-like protein [Alkalibacter saccharofermentans]SHF04237.1 phosphoglycolate phosphatase [Alkalibacter saccharofermentans DSM 14828]